MLVLHFDIDNNAMIIALRITYRCKYVRITILDERCAIYVILVGGGSRAVVSTAAFHARVRGS